MRQSYRRCAIAPLVSNRAGPTASFAASSAAVDGVEEALRRDEVSLAHLQGIVLRVAMRQAPREAAAIAALGPFGRLRPAPRILPNRGRWPLGEFSRCPRRAPRGRVQRATALGLGCG